MEATNSVSLLDAISSFLVAQDLTVYVTVIVIFAVLEFGLSRPDNRPPIPTGRYVVNFGLPMLGALLAMVLPFGSAGAALLADARAWGLFNTFSAPGVLILSIALMARTLLAYWLHRAMHAVPLLWRIHRIHHTDPMLDISTGLRHHPLELVIAAPLFLALVIVLGLPLWAVLLVDFFMLAGSLFKHLDIDLPPKAERLLGPVLATPAIHRFHHSARATETNSNFGNLVIVWDLLFRTYTDPKGRRPNRLGLGERYDDAAHNLWLQLQIGVVDSPAPEKRPTDDL
ncbi:MAG: sterol desaturase family protein [Novosphingobium sp.]